jgi:hypothetical protein
MENKNYQINRKGKSSSLLREIRQVFNNWMGRLPLNSQNSDISEYRNQNQKSNNPGVANSNVVFFEWQKKFSEEVFPLHNVTAKKSFILSLYYPGSNLT